MVVTIHECTASGRTVSQDWGGERSIDHPDYLARVAIIVVCSEDLLKEDCTVYIYLGIMNTLLL